MKTNKFTLALSFLLSLFTLNVLSAQNKIELPCGKATIPFGGGTTTTENPPAAVPVPPSNNTGGSGAFEGDRLVFWVHGLNGSDQAWIMAASDIENRYKIDSWTKITYPQFTLQSAGQVLHDQLTAADHLTKKADWQKNFIVAHSQGGKVSKACDKWYSDLNQNGERRFGGIVTFGTPHQGAQIINNTRDQNNLAQPSQWLTDYVNTTSSDLLAGPAKEKIKSSFILDLFVPNALIDNAIGTVSNYFNQFVAPNLVGNNLPPITEEFKVGSPVVATLNNFSANSPSKRAAFYGIEEKPVMWRTLLYFSVKNPNASGTYGASPDNDLVDKMNTNRTKYVNKVNSWNTTIGLVPSWIPNSFPVIPFGSNQISVNAAMDIRDEWQKGVNWFNNADDKYLTFIGAKTTSVVSSTGYTCNCGSYTVPTSTGSCPPGCTAGSGTTILTTVSEEKPSDGVVLVESASNYPGAPTRLMDKSSHMQMRNDGNTEKCLDGLLAGQQGSYFTTKKR